MLARDTRDSSTPPLEEVQASIAAKQYKFPCLSKLPGGPSRTIGNKPKQPKPAKAGPCRRIETPRRAVTPPQILTSSNASTLADMSVSSEGSLVEQVLSGVPARAPRTKRTKRVIHKIFADCIECTDDPEWKEHLSEAASGKLHNAMFVRNKLKYKGKESKELTVENLGSLSLVFREIVDFFQQKMCVCFTEVDKLKSESMEGAQFNPKNLSEVSSKQVFFFVLKFAETLGEENRLTHQEIRLLAQDLNFNIIRKVIPKSDFIMENRCIVQVDGATLEGGRFVITDNTVSPPVETLAEPRIGSIEAVNELIEKGIVKPLCGDFRLDYAKNKLPQKWKRMFKTTFV